MANNILKTRIQLRHDTAANWTAKNPVLMVGELGFEIDTNKFKIGDGVKNWNALEYAVKDEIALTDENVTMTDDFVFTAPVGTVTIPSSGSTTVSARDKTLREFLSALFAQAKNPSVTQPAASIRLNEAGAYEVGTKKTPSSTASLSAGSYQYGPATGITAETYSITNGTNEVCIASRIIHIHGHSTYNSSSETTGVFYICDDACLTTADVHDDV